MAKIVLTYFPGRGRAELSRWILKQAGADFEDKRITGEQFQAMKPDLLTGQLPLLECGDVKLSQSAAIAFCLANKYGLAGKTDVEKAEVHMMCECLNDLLTSYMKCRFEKDEEKKCAMMKEWKETTLPKWLEVFKKKLCGRDWLVGNEMTMADMAVACFLSDPAAQANVSEAVKANPEVCNLIKRVTCQPNISKWISCRPESQF